MSSIIKLHLLGQSIWYDNIRRSLIQDGTLMDRIERREICGVTSNPSIFQKAIAESDDYTSDLKTMAWAGLDSKSIFYRLAIKDIQNAADLFYPYYEATGGADGFVSLEVNPDLAYDTPATIDEAMWLWQEVNRPNLMVKIPATEAGLPAITDCIAAGININVTLIFSRERYAQVMEAYVEGIERRVEEGLDASEIASVASFFVSRLETKADQRLQTIVDEEGEGADMASSLIGRIAVDNTRLAYQQYETFFTSQRFREAAEAGAQKQRPLWASTSTKNPNYSDIKYVESLIAENTVNTVPPKTLEAYLDHGDPQITIYDELEQAEEDFEKIAEVGISIDEITQELEDEGVKKFSDSYHELLDVIESYRQEYLAELGDLAVSVESEVKAFRTRDIIARMHRIDPKLWTNEPAGKSEVQKRLGWLTLPKQSQSLIADLEDFADQCKAEGFEKVLLLGMGGSSLAPETISLVLGDQLEGMDLKILDSTIPEQVSLADEWVDYQNTLFIVASKSGTTTETMSFFNYFWERAGSILRESRGNHFIAITDPGSKLAKMGKELGFRVVFTANPNVGGRYSALTHFGLVPAALMGVDLLDFLWEAEDMAEACSEDNDLEANPGAVLGIILGVAAVSGRDKLTFIADKALSPLEAWLEQLIAESSGKEDKGIVPITHEPLMEVESYGDDRLFVYLRHDGEHNGFVEDLKDVGQPALTLDVPGIYQLSGEFYRWEFAVAIACSILGVNAFDQPDVQDNKDRTKEKLQGFIEMGKLEEMEPIWSKNEHQVFGDKFDDLSNCDSLSEVIKGFIAQAKDYDYIAINAYVPRNEKNLVALMTLRESILRETGCATTLGFGPRFLHSTGQLHKGGANNGLFIQITQEDAQDFEIPKSKYTFGTLARAQAQGDLEALLARGRRAIRIHLNQNDQLALDI
jgi:transaldolase / glucose-6-phosphate isomerase